MCRATRYWMHEETSFTAADLHSAQQHCNSSLKDMNKTLLSLVGWLPKRYGDTAKTPDAAKRRRAYRAGLARPSSAKRASSLAKNAAVV